MNHRDHAANDHVRRAGTRSWLARLTPLPLTDRCRFDYLPVARNHRRRRPDRRAGADLRLRPRARSRAILAVHSGGASACRLAVRSRPVEDFVRAHAPALPRRRGYARDRRAVQRGRHPLRGADRRGGPASCFAAMSLRPATRPGKRAEFALFFFFSAFNLSWFVLRNVSVAIDEYIYFETLDGRRIGYIALMLAMLAGLPFPAFVIAINRAWGCYGVAGIRLVQPRGHERRARGPSRPSAHIPARKRTIGGSDRNARHRRNLRATTCSTSRPMRSGWARRRSCSIPC